MIELVIGLHSTCDIVLHQMFIQRVGNPQSADECESTDILTTVVYFWQLTLKVVNVCLKTVRGSYLDGEEVVVVLLELLARGVHREGQLAEILKVVDRL